VPGEHEADPEHVQAGGDGEEPEHPVRCPDVGGHVTPEVSSRSISAAPSTASPAQATASSASDSQDGPSEYAAVEMMPVAITYAK
jgi:hypothetical protein